jgi:hypothetical protein
MITFILIIIVDSNNLNVDIASSGLIQKLSPETNINQLLPGGIYKI